MRPEMSDRPVSLAAVLGEITRANEYGDIDDGPFVKLENALRALPTFAPATHGGREMSGEADRNMGSSAYAAELDEHTAPTKPPREMPAPAREWTGPDRWQAWCNLGTPDDVPVTPGFVAIGPWEPCGITVRDNGGNSHVVRDWRRPLRRVQA